MTPEDKQSMVGSVWEKRWNNFYANLTLKYDTTPHHHQKKKHNLRNYNQKLFYHV